MICLSFLNPRGQRLQDYLFWLIKSLLAQIFTNGWRNIYKAKIRLEFVMATIKEEVHQISLTEAAALKVKGLAEQEGKKESSLRVYISGGGCSGYSYGLTLDETIASNDLVFEEHGVKVLVDPESMKMLSGCVVD